MKYRKRPLVIEAEQATERTTILYYVDEGTGGTSVGGLQIRVTAVKRPDEPKPDIFELTYEPAE
jgi:hypothetical protein